MSPTTVHLACVHATLRLGESSPEAIAAECGIDLETTRRALLVLTSRRAARWDAAAQGYVPVGTAKALPVQRVVAL